MRDADDGMQMINCGPQGGYEAGHIQRDRDSYDVIYQITEPYRPQKGLLFPERIRYEFLNALQTKFAECFDCSSGDPYNIYNQIIFKLRGFPRQDDSRVWECFQSVLQEALDIYYVWI